MINELVEEFENRQSSQRKKASVAAICSKETITTLAVMTSMTTTSQEDTPFKYKIKIPWEGQSNERPILYISRNTKPFERNYESTERELACVVWAFIKLRHLLEGSDTILVTDHAPIKEVLRTSAATQYSLRLDKFRLLLAPFLDKLKVMYRPGKQMTNVDLLSQATWMENNDNDAFV